ncbi:rhodanese-like domain-containing protein [uncultured Pseudomonas sp.]|uniref:rhodanese-like domain-containing protein n=1 Tax=uncultured Pseudomonas sp. TaxID=114707 RepID=UPI002634DCD4|nr:rhodanese-like domain-containing protein [uncultured Pseudomonas sp.]
MRRLFATLSLLICLPLMAGEVELNAAVTALQSPDTLLIDVRTAEEFADGALPNAERIGYEQIASQISALAPDKNTPIVLYCRSGRRSSIAEESLRTMGYTNLINAGGYDELKVALESQD